MIYDLLIYDLRLDSCEAFDVVIDVVGNHFRPRLLVLDKLIVHILEVGELLEECHKLLIAQFDLYLLTMLQPEGVGIVDKLRRLT